MSSPFRYGNYRSLAEGCFDQHMLCPRAGVRFSTGFKSLESLRHALFGKRMTLETMMLSCRPLGAIQTLLREKPERAERLDRVDAVLRAYPVLLEISHDARAAVSDLLEQLSPRRIGEWREIQERVLGMSFYDKRDKVAYVLTYAHRRFYLWKLRGDSIKVPEPRGTWEVKCVITHLLYDSGDRARLLVERAAPKRHPVNLRRVITGLPDYLRRDADIVSCFHAFDPEVRTRIVRGRDRTHIRQLDTTPAWFVHAFMGHDVRGNMIVVRLGDEPSATLAQTSLDQQNVSVAYRAIPPAIVISPETQHMFRLFSQPKCWARYRTDSERTQYVREHAGYRVDAVSMVNVRHMEHLTRHPNELVRMNREEMHALLHSYATKEELGISLHVLAQMEAQAGQ